VERIQTQGYFKWKCSGLSAVAEVLAFLKDDDSNGKFKECSICYSDNWDHYFNHLGRKGQRIGMYCKAVDRVGS